MTVHILNYFQRTIIFKQTWQLYRLYSLQFFYCPAHKFFGSLVVLSRKIDLQLKHIAILYTVCGLVYHRHYVMSHNRTQHQSFCDSF